MMSILFQAVIRRKAEEKKKKLINFFSCFDKSSEDNFEYHDELKIVLNNMTSVCVCVWKKTSFLLY